MRNERLKQSVFMYFAIINVHRTRDRLSMRSLEFFILLYPGGLAMALRSTRARIFPGGKGGRCRVLATLQTFYVPIVWKSGILTLLES